MNALLLITMTKIKTIVRPTSLLVGFLFASKRFYVSQNLKISDENHSGK